MTKKQEKEIQTDDEKITILLEDEQSQPNDEAAKQKQLNNELVCDLRRLSAEFENYRRRTDIQVASMRNEGNYEVIEKLLPLMDAFENAQNLVKDSKVLEGVELIRKQLDEVFKHFSVSKIEALGAEFDPSVHNAVFTKEDAANSGNVVEVVKTGYKIGEKVLRYAFVVVAQ